MGEFEPPSGVRYLDSTNILDHGASMTGGVGPTVERYSGKLVGGFLK